MKYRVAFAKRLDSGMRPSVELDLNLSDGVVADKVFVEQLESASDHGEDAIQNDGEDDGFLSSAAPEVWDYEVVDGRGPEFEQALQNSELVLEYDVVDDTLTSRDELDGTPLRSSRVYPRDGGVVEETTGSRLTRRTP
jgi:hypothetical protein